MNVASSLPGPLVTQASAGDLAHATRSAGDEQDGTDQDSFGRLLSELTSKPADPAATADAANTAAAPAGAADGAVRSLADLLSQIASAPSDPQADRGTQMAPASARTLQSDPTGAALQGAGSSIDLQATIELSAAHVAAAGAGQKGAAADVAANRGSDGQRADDVTAATSLPNDAVDPRGTHATGAAVTGASDKRGGVGRHAQHVATDALGDELSNPGNQVAATADASATSAPTAAIAAMTPPQAMLVQTQNTGAAATPKTAAPVAVPGRAGAASKTANLPASAQRATDTSAGDDGVDVSAMPASAADATHSDSTPVSDAVGEGIVARAVITKQETHLPLVAGGPAMQVAVAVKAELAGAVEPSGAAVGGPAEPVSPAGRTLVRTLSMVLTPENLGTVSVDLRLAGGRLELSIVAEHHDAAQAIERDKAALSNALSSSGVSVDSVVVRTAASASAGDPSLGASGGSSQHSGSQQGGSTASGGGSSNGGTGDDGRQASGSDRRSNGGQASRRPGTPDPSGGSLFV